jgi:superkiller protein 3
MGRLDEAIAAYRRSIELRPDHCNGYIGLGLALDAQGKLDEAIAANRKAIELEPDNAVAHCNLGGSLWK